MIQIGTPLRLLHDTASAPSNTVFFVQMIAPDTGLLTLGNENTSLVIHMNEIGTVFEPCSLEPQQTATTHPWTPWQEITMQYHNMQIALRYKTNGRKVKAEVGHGTSLVFRASASCHPNDTFNLALGLNLCLARLMLKVAQFTYDELMLSITGGAPPRMQQ